MHRAIASITNTRYSYRIISACMKSIKQNHTMMLQYYTCSFCDTDRRKMKTKPSKTMWSSCHSELCVHLALLNRLSHWHVTQQTWQTDRQTYKQDTKSSYRHENTVFQNFPELAKTKFQGFPGLKKRLFKDFPGYTPFTNMVAWGQKVHIPNQFSM